MLITDVPYWWKQNKIKQLISDIIVILLQASYTKSIKYTQML